MARTAVRYTAGQIAKLGKDNIPSELLSGQGLVYSSPATLAYNSPGAEGFGVKRAGLAVPESVMLIVSPGCCGRNTSIVSSMPEYKDRFFYLLMDETDLVTGRHLKRIPDAVCEVVSFLEGQKGKKPKVVMICITCVDALLGTDMERVCNACEKALGDGTRVRPLNHTEILQIAGRAGRYQMYDIGEVTAIGDNRPILHALHSVPEQMDMIRIAFPGEEAIASPYSLRKLLEEWQRLPREAGYDREDMSDALLLLRSFPTNRMKVDKELLYRLITCPVDTGNLKIIAYWVRCAKAIAQGEEIPIPNYGMSTLEKCETQYRALDLYHHLCRRFDQEDRCEGFRRDVIKQIAKLLLKPKTEYAQ